VAYNDHYQNNLGQKVLKKTTTNPKGTQTIEIFDAHGNLSSLEKMDSNSVFLLREEFFYNSNDQKIKQVSSLFNPNRKAEHTVLPARQSRAPVTSRRALFQVLVLRKMVAKGANVVMMIDGRGCMIISRKVFVQNLYLQRVILLLYFFISNFF